ncbi:GlsB/YeaQ/YmgE family stress response membrane protein [bacterium]|nr:GlsB/YeaQ/YmgE family stress response membrane protein [bacterium]
MNILWFIIIGAVAGWLAGQIMKGKGFGFLGNLIVGIIGGFLGGFVFDQLGIVFYGIIGSLIAAVVGAVILLFIIRLFRKK